MKAEIINGNLVITIPVINPPGPSKSGKTLIVATTSGAFVSTLQVQGKPLTVNLNAYIPRG